MMSDDALNLELIYETPTIDELVGPIKYECSECTSTFSNKGNFLLHMAKHHEKTDVYVEADRKNILYLCPVVKCPYNLSANKKILKYFLTKKDIRQHYQRMHVEKSVVCPGCSKSFPSETTKLYHQKIECGQVLKCADCDWEYKTRVALMTHCKRKGHTMPVINNKLPKKPAIHLSKKNTVKTSKDLISMVKCETVHVEKGPASIALTGPAISTEESKKLKSQTTQTIFDCSTDDSTNDNIFLDNWNNRASKLNKSTKDQQTTTASIPCNNNVQQSSTSTTNDKPKKEYFRNLDLFDAESLNVLTNSCSSQTDENLNKLTFFGDDDPNSLETYFATTNSFATGLCHIETQTDKFIDLFNDNGAADSGDSNQINPSFSTSLYSHMHTQTCDEILSELGLSDIQTQTNWPMPAVDNRGADLELFVSTETQTSFTTCLLESSQSIQTQTTMQMIDGTGTDTSFFRDITDGSNSNNSQSIHTQTGFFKS